MGKGGGAGGGFDVMGFKPPKPPDPYEVAGANAFYNTQNAIGNAWLGNANERSPLGTVTYRETGRHQIKTPHSLEKEHAPSDQESIEVPQFERVVELSPEQQQAYDQTMAFANRSLGQINQNLATPFSLENIGLGENLPTYDNVRNETEAGLFSRLNPQLQRDRDSLETRLANQGINLGSEAYTRGVDEFGRQSNDARTQVLLASNAEARAAQQSEMARRGQVLSEHLTERNQPINELTAVMGANAVSMPQFAGFRGPQTSETPLGGYWYDTARMEQDQWKTQIQAQVEMEKARMQAQAADRAATSGLMGQGLGMLGKLGGAKLSDRRLKRDIEQIGYGLNGLPLYMYRYLWSDVFEVGHMADEVVRVAPAAVFDVGGYLAVDYAKLGGVHGL